MNMIIICIAENDNVQLYEVEAKLYTKYYRTNTKPVKLYGSQHIQYFHTPMDTNTMETSIN